MKTILSWGKPFVEFALLGANQTPGVFAGMPTIVKDTAKQTSTEGNETNAEGEGGELVAVRSEKNKHQFECEVFVKKGDAKPIEDDDGVVDGEYAVRLTPEDDENEGFIFERSQVRAIETWSGADGKRWKYIFKALQPSRGKAMKPYVAAGLVVAPTALYFGNAADSTGKSVAVTSTANPTATSTESWCTTSVSGKTVTVKVTANSGTEARTATVTISADGKTTRVPVTQIPA